jgi:hypothetical protein
MLATEITQRFAEVNSNGSPSQQLKETAKIAFGQIHTLVRKTV